RRAPYATPPGGGRCGLPVAGVAGWIPGPSRGESLARGGSLARSNADHRAVAGTGSDLAHRARGGTATVARSLRHAGSGEPRGPRGAAHAAGGADDRGAGDRGACGARTAVELS